MNKYHKIQTVFLRDPATKMKTLLEGKFAKPEFEYLQYNEWTFTEKVDGTNIRVMINDEGKVEIGGRTDDAQIPAFLFERLMEIFTQEKFKEEKYRNLIFFGEGYGNKIQKVGSEYISDGVDFILFDVNGGGHYYRREVVEDIANETGLKVVPIIAKGKLLDAVDMAKNKFSSVLKEQLPEGLVMRPSIELENNQGHRVISKIKLKDFR